MSAPATKKNTETDWARLDAMTDAEIDTSDIPPLTEEQLRQAVPWTLGDPLPIVVRLESDVRAWYRAQGADGDRLLNETLRQYINGHAQLTAP
ncbi:MAG: BrnA antitoxin family protein [Chloroflexota bacterium]|nr:BrnA antitoxin family protein [Chloroflexota bacterium]